MKTKLALLFTCAELMVSAQTNSVHNWTLKSGAVFAGDYFTSGELMVVIKSHGTNCLLKISDLSTNDWLYFYQCKTNQRQMQLDAEAKQLGAQGYIEVNAQLLENFPEKVLNYQKGWMDVTFQDFSQYHVEFADMQLGLRVTDSNGNSLDNCTIFKQLNRPDQNTQPIPNPLVSVAMTLKPGDRIRLIGHGYPDVDSDDSIHRLAGNSNHAGFLAEGIEMIESAADAATVKKVKEALESSQ
jgi:hypothetical protein